MAQQITTGCRAKFHGASLPAADTPLRQRLAPTTICRPLASVTCGSESPFRNVTDCINLQLRGQKMKHRIFFSGGHCGRASLSECVRGAIGFDRVCAEFISPRVSCVNTGAAAPRLGLSFARDPGLAPRANFMPPLRRLDLQSCPVFPTASSRIEFSLRLVWAAATGFEPTT